MALNTLSMHKRKTSLQFNGNSYTGHKWKFKKILHISFMTWISDLNMLISYYDKNIFKEKKIPNSTTVIWFHIAMCYSNDRPILKWTTNQTLNETYFCTMGVPLERNNRGKIFVRYWYLHSILYKCSPEFCNMYIMVPGETIKQLNHRKRRESVNFPVRSTVSQWTAAL